MMRPTGSTVWGGTRSGPRRRLPNHARRRARQELVEALTQTFSEHQPANTSRTYAVYKAQFKDFCKKNGWEWSNLQNRDAYIAKLLMHRASGASALAHTTILGPVCGAMFDLFRMEQHNPMESALVREAKKVVKWSAPAPRKAKEALPLGWLRKAVQAARADKDSFTGWSDVCIFLIMFTALLRQSEVVRLAAADVRIEPVTQDGVTKNTVMITVRKAKNDQERKGSVRPW
jgi:hypothetical protein